MSHAGDRKKVERAPQIQWTTSRFADDALEQAYGEESWKSVRLLTALTLIGFSVAWLASVSIDMLYLQGTSYYPFAAGVRSATGVSGVLIGSWLLLVQPGHGQRLPSLLVYLWMLMSTLTAVTAAWIYPFVETTADGRTDLLVFTCYWMSLQILGLGTALSAWRKGIVLMAIIYAGSFIIQMVYWGPQLEHRLEAQIILIIAASLFAVILSYLFARRARQRFFITTLYEEAKDAAEQAQRFSTFLLAATGHDIRQPVFALNLNAVMLEDVIRDRDWDKAARLAQRQRQALSGISGLISSILELSQLDTNRRRVSPEPLALGDVIGTALAPVHAIAGDRGIDLRLVGTSLTVDADRGVVEHILANLVANAVNHAGADRVLVGAKRRGEHVDLLVIDDGKGLSDRAQTLTLADIRPDKDRPASRGLGVEIMFRLAEKAGLDLVLSSEPERGVAARLRCPKAS